MVLSRICVFHLFGGQRRFQPRISHSNVRQGIDFQCINSSRHDVFLIVQDILKTDFMFKNCGIFQPQKMNFLTKWFKFGILYLNHMQMLFEAFYEFQIHYVCTGICKRILKHYGLWTEFLDSIFQYIQSALNITKLTYISFHPQKHITIRLCYEYHPGQRKRIWMSQ